MQGQFLVAGGNRAARFQPADAAFDDAAPAIADCIVADRAPRSSSATRAFGRDDGADAVPPQPHPNAARVIGPITTEMARPAARRAVPAPDVDTIDDRLELGRLVGLARQQRSGERQATPIGQEVQLGAKAAFGAAQGMVRRLGRGPPFFRAPAAARLARIEVLSIHH